MISGGLRCTHKAIQRCVPRPLVNDTYAPIIHVLHMFLSQTSFLWGSIWQVLQHLLARSIFCRVASATASLWSLWTLKILESYSVRHPLPCHDYRWTNTARILSLSKCILGHCEPVVEQTSTRNRLCKLYVKNACTLEVSPDSLRKSTQRWHKILGTPVVVYAEALCVCVLLLSLWHDTV